MSTDLTALVATLFASIQESMGDAFTQDEASAFAAEVQADASTLAYLFNLNQKLADEFDPDTMSDFLPRWEKIYGIAPDPSASISDRQAAVKLKKQARGWTRTNAFLFDLLTQLLGANFISLTPGDPALQIGSIPGGLSIPGGATLVDGDFCSHVAQVFIHVEKTMGQSALDFANAQAQLPNVLKQFLPAWTDWTVYQNNSHGANGFRLDEPNLDIEALTL